VDRLFETIRETWPNHGHYLDRLAAAMTPQDWHQAESVAGLVLRIAADRLPRVCDDYQWLCGKMREEQLHFARYGRYRLQTFEEARREVYDDDIFMARYINGLLIGRVTWIEQLRTLRMYTEVFLPGHAGSYDHLEVGPGHGLLLHLAAEDSRCTSLTALDVSRTSLQATVHSMGILRSARLPELLCDDVQAGNLAAKGAWSSIVVSEVLEHLEQPHLALDVVAEALVPGGRAFITSPANSPMPDHIHLFRTPDEVVRLVEASGLRVLEQQSFTGVGVSAERARKQHLPIACAVVAERPDR